MTTQTTCSHVGNARVSRCECIPMAARGWHRVFLDDSLSWVCHLNLKLANLASLASQFIWGSSVSSSGALGLQAVIQHLPGTKYLNAGLHACSASILPTEPSPSCSLILPSGTYACTQKPDSKWPASRIIWSKSNPDMEQEQSTAWGGAWRQASDHRHLTPGGSECGAAFTLEQNSNCWSRPTRKLAKTRKVLHIRQQVQDKSYLWLERNSSAVENWPLVSAPTQLFITLTPGLGDPKPSSSLLRHQACCTTQSYMQAKHHTRMFFNWK